MIDVDARGRHEAELLREEAARIADTDTALQSVLAGEVVVPLEPRRPAVSRPAVARRPGSTRRWIQVVAGIAAAAVVVAVLVVRRSNDPEVALPADTAVTSSTELVARPLDPPIRCELETCPSLAVSPEGTLVAFDQAARTLTWYHAEPHTLPVTADFDAAQVRLEAIGPDGIAFFLAGTPGTESWELVAVDASGDEVLGAVNSSGDVEPSVNGLIQRSCWSECEPPTRWLMSWVPGGFPSKVTHPDVELTSATVTVRLGELRWAIEWPHTLSTRSQVALRWDGGAVLSLVSESAAASAELIELLPDGSIQRFGLGDEAVHVLLRDGSAVVWRDGQLVRLSPPQPAERPAAWSPELTAHPVEPPIDCERSPLPTCLAVAVSPDGTLVAYDDAAATLTWYDDGEPRVVPITTEFDWDHSFLAVGPHDIAYFVIWGRREIVAVAPSGEEITRVVRGGGLTTTLDAGASGIVETHCIGRKNRCTVGSVWSSRYAELAMPWVDLAGDPITDRRPDPEVTGTDAGIEVRLGAREWRLVGEPWKDRPRPEVFPRSDGGVVMLLDTFDAEDRPWQLLELLPDGTIERYFVDVDHGWSALALPDGSVIVVDDLDLRLVRLTPPA